MEEKRAPELFRPAEVPKGRPFGKAGRPGTAVLVVGLIVVVAVALIVYAAVR
jgi:hypothetical protein